MAEYVMCPVRYAAPAAQSRRNHSGAVREDGDCVAGDHASEYSIAGMGFKLKSML